MKTKLLLLCLMGIFGFQQARAQAPYPGCADLLVENISVGADSVFHVLLSNSCTGCASGIEGPIYCEMRLIRTVAPFDTIARTDCYCLYTPLNGDTMGYAVKGVTSTLPVFGTYKVQLLGACDSIPFASSFLGTNDRAWAEAISVYPNPVSDILVLGTNLTEPVSVTITDTGGRIVRKAMGGPVIRIDMSRLPAGSYTVTIINSKTGVMTAKKIVRK